MAIEIIGLTKKYKDVVAVDNINLTIEDGQLFALLGVNGAGKSTTIKMLSTLLKPTSGTAKINGYDISDDAQEIKGIISISPQDTAIAPNLSVLENLYFMAGIYGIKRADAKQSVEKLVKLFRFESILNKKAKRLSGGWQRKLSIALAVLAQPKVLFLDEPTLGLDVLSRTQLWQFIKSLKGNIIIVLTTHYMEEAEELADMVGIMSGGKLIACDTCSNLIEKTKEDNFAKAFVKIVGGEV